MGWVSFRHLDMSLGRYLMLGHAYMRAIACEVTGSECSSVELGTLL
jgi:hypothetical protein